MVMKKKRQMFGSLENNLYFCRRMGKDSVRNDALAYYIALTEEA